MRIVPHGSDRMLSVYSEVSPLTSPRASTDLNQAGSPDVSPIEPHTSATQEFSKSDYKLRSQLPVLRKAPPAAGSSTGDAGNPLGGRRRSAEGVEGREDTPPLELSKEERLADLREKNRKLLSGFQVESRPKKLDGQAQGALVV